jgi:uncharacterized small protein (DUF1192 family)
MLKLGLINYLKDNFLTLQALLDWVKIDESELRQYQDANIMPKASYRLTVDLNCDSFFGPHKESQILEYYAKGYASWLGMIKSLKDERLIYGEFARRYRDAIALLQSQGHSSANPKMSSALPQHIEAEWGHFIQGIYGLCTRSGLPEDIAAKELAIVQITELTEKGALNTDELERLTRAVNLLDTASAHFAPHERVKSSRHRLVDDIRRAYRLQG